MNKNTLLDVAASTSVVGAVLSTISFFGSIDPEPASFFWALSSVLLWIYFIRENRGVTKHNGKSNKGY